MEQILSKYELNIVFTFEQFNQFCKYWRRYLDIVPFMKPFFLYPVDNGVQLGDFGYTIHMNVLALSSPINEPHIYPGFISTLDQYSKLVEDIHGKLVIFSNIPAEYSSSNGMLDTFEGARIPIFMGGGACNYETFWQSMNLEGIHKRYVEDGIDFTLDTKERCLIYGNPKY